MTQYRLTAQRWQAIQNNDPRADRQFFYAVTSTGIFCRPSCASRLPKRQHVRIFKTSTQALSAGFRPCKRCCPTGTPLSDAAWCAEIKQIIDHNYARNLTLTELAQLAHGAPYYLHHKFTMVTGLTPQQYLTQVRLQHAKVLLRTTTLTIKTIAANCGWPNPNYFSTLFKRTTDVTPSQYRSEKDCHATND
ncbi:bifunctional transcriptional activator/DNA repair enzyme AdaA [Loigolactobacillus binensis]|uniref:Bifunctional transcriptional activator/DNA repair enzyme AdaA n=1 Tax=Loigolactobacillus binensis TaxID=2559922 RepID=A0ABW3EBQ9_9LACO|nr:bifunctional transcriptional activator/DNA repair enzyme AdaA [Loigolactobacillus binensis]